MNARNEWLNECATEKDSEKETRWTEIMQISSDRQPYTFHK